jgi:hypothetical protein
MVPLRPEDLRHIADLMKDWVPPHHARTSLDHIQRNQAAMLPLLTASKVGSRFLPEAIKLILGFLPLLRPSSLHRLRH